MFIVLPAGACCVPGSSQARAKSRPRGARQLLLRPALLGLLTVLAFSPARATQVFEQPHNGTGTIYHSSWIDPDGSNYDQFIWDSFTLPAGAAVTELRWRGGYDPDYAYWDGPVLNFTVAIYPSNGGLWEPDVVNGPLAEYEAGDDCGQTAAGIFGGVALYDYHFTLPSPFQAAAGARYWIQATAWQQGIPSWGFAAASGGNGSHFRHWSEYGFQNIPGDQAFSLHTSDAPTATISASVEPVGTGSVFGAGVYPIGSSCTLTATAGAGYGFDSWTDNGTVVETNALYTFAVSADRALVAHFVPACVVTTDCWPGMGGRVTGSGTYNAGTPVTMMATPNLGYDFVAWLEWGSTPVSNSPSYTFTATGDVLLVAQFQQQTLAATFDFDTGTPPVGPYQSMPSTQTQHGLTATFSAPTSSWSVQNTLWGYVPTVFSGNFLFPSGYYYNALHLQFSDLLTDASVAFCTGDYEAETDIPTLVRMRAYVNTTDNPPVAEATMRGEWVILVYPEGILQLSSPTPFNLIVVDIPSGQGPTATGIFYADNFNAVRAPTPTATLTAESFPPEGGLVSGAGTYPAGSTVTLEAVANEGWVFDHWEENFQPTGTSPLLDLVLDADRSLTAVFAPVLAVAYDAQAEPAVVTLSWPWPAAGYVLREKEMTIGAVWLDSPLPVQVVGGRNVAQAPVNPDRQVTFLLRHL